MELHEKDLLDFNGKLQDLDDKLENYTVTLNKKINQASGADLDGLTNNVSTNTSKISTLEKSLSDYKTETNTKIITLQSKTSNLQSSLNDMEGNLDYAFDIIDSINQDLTTKEEQINTLNTKVTTLENTVSTNSSNIETLKTDNETNKSNIETLQNDMTTAKQDILDLKNSPSGDTTELEEKINKIENVTNKFITLIKDRNASTSPDYTEIDPETVVQTYDYADRLYDFTGTGDFHSAEFYFSVPNDCNAHLKITTHITSDTYGQGNLKLFFNGDTLTDTFAFNYDTTTTFVEFDFDKSVLANGNMLYFKLSANTSIHFTYAKIEISGCTNPVMLLKAKKFDVIYALDKYYLADCSTGVLKLATIGVNDIATTNDIVWEDTGIDARECAFTLESSDTTYPYKVKAVHYAVIHKDNTISFFDTNRNIEKHLYASIGAAISYCYSEANNIYYHLTAINDIYHRKSAFYTSNSTDFYLKDCDITLRSAYYKDMKRNSYDLIDNKSLITKCSQLSNGDIVITYRSNSCNIGKGVLIEVYSYGYSPITINVIAKVFNTVIKFVLAFQSGNLTIISKTVLGYYDFYFIGANNDYFIVKYNKLCYYKNGLQPIEENTN